MISIEIFLMQMFLHDYYESTFSERGIRDKDITSRSRQIINITYATTPVLYAVKCRINMPEFKNKHTGYTIRNKYKTIFLKHCLEKN